MAVSAVPVEAVFLAIGASMAFAISTLSFKKFAIELSPIWMNAFKCLVAGIAFFIFAVVPAGFSQAFAGLSSIAVVLALLSSGFAGLNIGDLFLMRSFRKIGSGRTIMFLSFNPLFLGVASYILFGQAMKGNLWLGIAFLCICILLLGSENYSREGAWKLRNYLEPLLAAMLDSVGILLTRWAFDQSPHLSLSMANFIRCVGAIMGFAVVSRYYPIHLRAHFKSLSTALRTRVVIVSVTGTFFSLYLWIAAIRFAPLGVIAALGATGPLVITAIETRMESRTPSWQLLVAGVFFVAGVLTLSWRL